MGVESVKRILQRKVNEAIWHQPSALYFDDLDLLLPVDSEQQHGSRSKRIGQFFIDLLKTNIETHQMTLIATCMDKSKLNEIIIKSQLFQEYFKMNLPEKVERMSILESIITDIGDLNMEELSTVLDGYCLADLSQFYQVLKNENSIRSSKLVTKIPVSMVDVNSALKKFTPVSLSGAKLAVSTTDYSSIGGMFEIKTEMIKRMKFPALFTQLFANSPLRLQTGMLLFGYPGCGKTMLASAVAKECGLNFISVKGPELLNKYIGGSEKSVRDLFNRARSAKPCLLFFLYSPSYLLSSGQVNTPFPCILLLFHSPSYTLPSFQTYLPFP